MRPDKRNGLVDADHTSPQNQAEKSASANVDQNKHEYKYFNGAVYLSPRRWYIYHGHSKEWQRSTKDDLALRLRADGHDAKAMLQHIQRDHAVDAVVLRAESILVTAEGRRWLYTNESGDLAELAGLANVPELADLPVGVHTTEDGRQVLVADRIRFRG
jgi:hypothetical protein